jgi:hypothetical protein
MKKTLYILPFFLILFSITACDRLQSNKYEFSKDLTGQTIRLDKQTGEMVIINGNKMERVRTEEEVAIEKEEEKRKLIEEKQEAESKKNTEQFNLQIISRKINWKSSKVPLLGGIDLGLATSWTNGKINYKFTIDGSDFELLKKARDNNYSNAYFNINFEDANGFKTFSINVPIKQMTQTVNENNKILGYVISDSTIVRQETYQSLASWSATWGGFN